MPVGLANMPIGGYNQDATSGVEHLFAPLHIVHYPGGIVIDATAVDSSSTPNSQLRRGLVLGKITTSGKYKGRDSNATDGSQVARGILDNNVDMRNPNGSSADSGRPGMVIHGFYHPGKVHTPDGTDITGSGAAATARRELFGISGSAGSEVITGCQLSPIV